MPRYQLSITDRELTIDRHDGPVRIVTGMALYVMAMLCDLAIGLISIAFQSQRSPMSGQDDNGFLFNPHGNHLGFLWLVATLLIVVGAPFYFAIIMRPHRVALFDRVQNAFYRSGKFIARMNRIENVNLVCARDPDGRSICRPGVMHSDGFEVYLDETYQRDEALAIVNAIGDFVGCPVVIRAASGHPITIG